MTTSKSVWDKEIPVPVETIQYVDRGVLEKLPPGTQIIDISPSGASYWARTAKIDAVDANGKETPFFIKVHQHQLGKDMVYAECQVMKEMYKVMPELVAEPLAWGTYQDMSDTYFYVCRFRELSGEIPEACDFPPLLAEMHKRSALSYQKFGYPITAYGGRNPHWFPVTDSWEECFSRGLQRNLEVDNKVQGLDPEFEVLKAAFFEKVIPRLLRPLETEGRKVTPVLVHGDMWDGNVSVDETTGEPIIFDATPIYAHNEYELAPWWAPRHQMTKAYIDKYVECYPKSDPDEDFDDRGRLYCMSFDLHSSTLYPGNMRYRNLVKNHMRYLLNKYPLGYEGYLKEKHPAAVTLKIPVAVPETPAVAEIPTPPSESPVPESPAPAPVVLAEPKVPVPEIVVAAASTPTSEAPAVAVEVPVVAAESPASSWEEVQTPESPASASEVQTPEGPASVPEAPAATKTPAAEISAVSVEGSATAAAALFAEAPAPEGPAPVQDNQVAAKTSATEAPATAAETPIPAVEAVAPTAESPLAASETPVSETAPLTPEISATETPAPVAETHISELFASETPKASPVVQTEKNPVPEMAAAPAEETLAESPNIAAAIPETPVSETLVLAVETPSLAAQAATPAEEHLSSEISAPETPAVPETPATPADIPAVAEATVPETVVAAAAAPVAETPAADGDTVATKTSIPIAEIPAAATGASASVTGPEVSATEILIPESSAPVQEILTATKTAKAEAPAAAETPVAAAKSLSAEEVPIPETPTSIAEISAAIMEAPNPKLSAPVPEVPGPAETLVSLEAPVVEIPVLPSETPAPTRKVVSVAVIETTAESPDSAADTVDAEISAPAAKVPEIAEAPTTAETPTTDK